MKVCKVFCHFVVHLLQIIDQQQTHIVRFGSWICCRPYLVTTELIWLLVQRSKTTVLDWRPKIASLFSSPLLAFFPRQHRIKLSLGNFTNLWVTSQLDQLSSPLVPPGLSSQLKSHYLASTQPFVCPFNMVAVIGTESFIIAMSFTVIASVLALNCIVFFYQPCWLSSLSSFF